MIFDLPTCAKPRYLYNLGCNITQEQMQIFSLISRVELGLNIRLNQRTFLRMSRHPESVRDP